MKYMRLLFCIILLSCASISSAQSEQVNAGFVQGLWYSNDEIIEGVPIRIYAAFRNNTPHDLKGTVRFTQNDTRIGSQSISVLSGRLIETWTDWTPTSGEHKIRVTLGEASLHALDGTVIPFDGSDIILTDTPVADIDTDTDGVGNQNDLDDDNDSMSDENEIASGTDPLVKNQAQSENSIASSTQESSENNTRRKERIIKEHTDQVGEGLEQFIEGGIADTLLGNVTEKVVRTKQSLDTYRDNRNSERSASETPNEEESTALGTYTDTATITRTQMETEKKGFFGALIAGISSIFQSIWTMMLWILSQTLRYPMFIQIVFLFGILYMLYRTARRFGRRQP